MSYSSYSGSQGYGSQGYGSRGYSRSFGNVKPSHGPTQARPARAPISPTELSTIMRPSVTLKWPALYPGQQVFMTAGVRVEPVTFLRNSLGLCQILYESGGTTMVWRRRLFTTMEEAESFLPANVARSMQANIDCDADTLAASDLDFDYDASFPSEIHHPVCSQSWRSGNTWEPGDGWARR